MARIVLDIEPKDTHECPFGDERGKCSVYNGRHICLAIEGKPLRNREDLTAKVHNYPIDFKRCPYCTTLNKELTIE